MYKDNTLNSRMGSSSFEVFLKICTVCGPWSGRKRRKWVSLILEAEICRVSCRNILLVCDKPTASELCRKSCVIENDRSVWRHLVRPVVPWSGHFGHFVSRHQKCAKRNVPSTIWSKFLYICNWHQFNFETKMKFLFDELWFGLMKNSVQMCVVQLSMRRQRNRYCFKWIQSKFREKEKFVACNMHDRLSRNYVFPSVWQNMLLYRAWFCGLQFE